jgi:2',3'-cyclic-nucleotide 2'-phosphodiesterase (5'-nucleotidase family)
MKTNSKFVSLFASSLLLVALAVSPHSATANTTFAVPGAPQNVTVVPAEGGFTVTWAAPATDGNSSISRYVVSGGLGTCTTAVDGAQRTAFVPAIGTSAAAFKVFAVNSLGFGTGSTASTSVEPGAAKVGFFGIDNRGFSRNLGSTTGQFNRIQPSASAYFGSVATPSGNGAWLLAPRNRVVALGDAKISAAPLDTLTVSIVPSYNGQGYYLIGSKGEVSASAGATAIETTGTVTNSRVIGAAATASGKGMWFVTTTGTVIGVGGAANGKLPKGNYNKVVARGSGEGFWAITTSGSIASFGDAPIIPQSIGRVKDATLASNGKGFYALEVDGTVTAVGDVPALSAGTGSRPLVALVNTAPIRDVKEVQINSFSDFHGALDYTRTTASGTDTYTSGASVMAANFAADRAKLPATFVVSSGDNFGASPPLSTVFDEIPTVKAMNFMGVDVSTFGNHEHDKALNSLNAQIAASDFKWVVSNYSSLTQLDGANTKGQKTAPWTIVNRGGVNLGVIGLNTPETAEVVFPGNLGNITIGDILGSSPVTKNQVLAAIKAARDAGADMVVSLVHEGYGTNNAQTGVAEGRLLDIAPLLDGSDLVLGGHSHLRFASVVGKKTVAQVPNAGTLYNRIHACVDTARKMTMGTLVEPVVPRVTAVAGTALASTTLNQPAIAMIDGYKAQLGAAYNVVIGQIADVAPNGGTPAIQRTVETGLGNYVADSLRAAMGTQIAITNGGGLRDMLPAKTFVPSDASIIRPSWASIQPGFTVGATPWKVTSSGPYTLTVGDVATVLPFGNVAATTTITGADVWAALENGVSQATTGGGRFPQVSGLKFTFDTSIAAMSGRVTAVTLTDGTPVPNDRTVSYTLATNDFMVAGGDGYTMFGGLAKAKTRDVLETIVRLAIIKDSLKGPVQMNTDGRITRIG